MQQSIITRLSWHRPDGDGGEGEGCDGCCAFVGNDMIGRLHLDVHLPVARGSGWEEKGVVAVEYNWVLYLYINKVKYL